MRRSIGTGRSEFHTYWNRRAVETELRLSRTEGQELRGVYSQLIGHYQRMAQMYDKAAALPTSV